MGAISINLFGPVAVYRSDTGSPIRMIRSALALLAYLAAGPGHPEAREVVAAELWPDSDPDRARASLATALWRMRTDLAQVPGAEAVVATESTLAIAPSLRAHIDAHRFEARAQSLLRHDPCPDALIDARAALDADCARGEALAGWYEPWALRVRVRLEDLRERCLGRLLDLSFAAGLDAEAFGLADRLLAIDPLREDVHQTLIRLHLRRGRRSLAQRQFERCRSVLADELGVAPAGETLALLGPANPAPSREQGDMQSLRLAIAEAQAGLNRLSREIDALIRS